MKFQANVWLLLFQKGKIPLKIANSENHWETPKTLLLQKSQISSETPCSQIFRVSYKMCRFQSGRWTGLIACVVQIWKSSRLYSSRWTGPIVCISVTYSLHIQKSENQLGFKVADGPDHSIFQRKEIVYKFFYKKLAYNKLHAADFEG